jgi:putative acetyltransferase
VEKSNISVRIARLCDLDQIRQLFYDTITTVNTRDYTPEQIAVWSSGYGNIERWEMKLREHYFLVAAIDDMIVGFTSLRDDGYLDFMYVHRHYQGRGIATMLINQLESEARGLLLKEIFVDVSITARPFFMSRGYTIKEMTVKEVKDVTFDNAVMQKVLS